MPEYIYDPVVTDEDALEAEALEYIQSRWPDFEPPEGSLVAWLIAACTRIIAEARDVAADVPAAIFKYWGTRVIGLPPVEATASVVDSTWTFVDNPAGRTIEQGTWVVIEGANGEPLTFEVTADVVVAAPNLATPAGAVSLRSIDTGVSTAGLGGPGTVVEPQDSIVWVDTITLTGETIGGTDEEEDEAYLDRLSARLTLLSPRPILPIDFVLLARDIAQQNGVEIRAVALDTYNPNTATYNNEATITLAVILKDTGANVAGAIKTAIDDGLQEMRQVNFNVFVIDPTRSTVDITFAGKAHPNYEPADVEARAEAAVTDFVTSTNWGKIFGAEQESWENATSVRLQAIATVLNNVEGFAYYTSITIGLNGGAQAAADTALPGAAPVTDPGVIAGTVTA